MDEGLKDLLDQMRALARQALADEEVFDLGAEIMKKAHSSLIKAGFTREEATMIVAHQGGLKLGTQN